MLETLLQPVRATLTAGENDDEEAFAEHGSATWNACLREDRHTAFAKRISAGFADICGWKTVVIALLTKRMEAKMDIGNIW